MPAKPLEALAKYFDITERGQQYEIGCKVCRQGWASPFTKAENSTRWAFVTTLSRMGKAPTRRTVSNNSRRFRKGRFRNMRRRPVNKGSGALQITGSKWGQPKRQRGGWVSQRCHSSRYVNIHVEGNAQTLYLRLLSLDLRSVSENCDASSPDSSSPRRIFASNWPWFS
jgi:hypothetical protein